MSSKNIEELLSKDGANDGGAFDFVYRGHSEIDRHYTKPMLPWIISEIKNQHRMQQVTVFIKDGNFEVKDKKSEQRILKHTVKQIHKCLMEQADHRCFLYTLRPLALNSQGSRKSSTENASELNPPLPANISTEQNYHCYLYQALTEQEVRNFFAALRQQPRESKAKDGEGISPLNSLAELSIHIESQFFEVLFVGRVKVSHFKVPATFIDEALQAFRNKEKERQRNTSGESRQRSSPSRMVSFQQEGSGYSVPNIVLRTPMDFEALFDKSSMKGNQDLLQGESSQSKNAKESVRSSRVRFHLGGSFDDQSRGSTPPERLSPQSSFSSAHSAGGAETKDRPRPNKGPPAPASSASSGAGKDGQDEITIKDLKAILKKLETTPNVEPDKEYPQPPSSPPPAASSLLSVEPFTQRIRTLSSNEEETRKE